MLGNIIFAWNAQRTLTRPLITRETRGPFILCGQKRKRLTFSTWRSMRVRRMMMA